MATQGLSKTTRPDGRFETTAGFVHHLLKQRPELSFDPEFSVEQFQSWKRKVKRKLRELMAFPKVPRQPAPKMIEEARRDGYRLQRWELYPEPRGVVPFIMLVPDAASAASPAPAVMCFPGSQQPKEALCGEPWDGPWVNQFGAHNFVAKHFVQAGFIALAFDNPATANLADPRCPNHQRASQHLIWVGRTYEGLSTFQKLVALKWLKKLDFVDRGRIAACGHSLGAKPALLLGLLDPAIRAVIWNDMATDWRVRDLVTNLSPVALWHYIPGFARWFDYMDLMAALAPTPLLITEGGRLDDHARIRKAYVLNGAAKDFKVTFMPNFSDPASRNREQIPEGIGDQEYSKYANYDGDHYFKDEVAVPWLCKTFSWDAAR